MLNVTGGCFIFNAFKGGFPIFESLCSVLAITDAVHIWDLGSDDGTLEELEAIAKRNNRLHIKRHYWPKIDAGVFADLANDIVNSCPTPNVVYWQGDEIMHETLAKFVKQRFLNQQFGICMERIQLRANFQEVKWLPHPVVRGVVKGKNLSFGDGMTFNSDETFMCCPNPVTGVMGCSRQFPWHEPKPGIIFDNHNPRGLNSLMAEVFPWEHFLVDTSSCFRDNQIDKRKLHAPHWREEADIIDPVKGTRTKQWMADAMADPAWEATESPFPLPKVCHGLVGMTKYHLRDEVRQSLITDDFSMWGL
jgi:hypothetical protein